MISKTEKLALTYAGQDGIHPLESVDRSNPRPGLRRWVVVNTATGERSTWKEAWLSIHHDGSATLVAAVGGHPMTSGDYFEGSQVQGGISNVRMIQPPERSDQQSPNGAAPERGQPDRRTRFCDAARVRSRIYD